MDRVRRLLKADEVHRAGITGKGVTAAVLDTGICMHPDYADRILFFRDFVNGRTTSYDDASHGSHVSGILGGDGRCSQGRYCGIAPGCNLIHLKVLDRYGQGRIGSIMAAIEWTVRNRARYDIRILNLSAGTSKKEEDESARELVALVEEAWDCGIAVVVAAGNQGPVPGSITVPGNSRKVITVGASDRNKAYSGCGPTKQCIRKPEVVAPGTNITSCSSFWQSGRYYTVKSGTSMAAPAIAGGIALLLELEPYLTNVDVKMRLKEAAVDQQLPDIRQGWGMPDLRRLLRLDIP
jgi:serine protease AprX